MSRLTLEIEQTLQKLDPGTASRLERLMRDALALVKPEVPMDAPAPRPEGMIRFPLVQGAKPISAEEVARLEEV